jgi:peroxiredoxin
MKQFNLFLVMICLAGCWGKTRDSSGLEGEKLPAFSLQKADSITYLNTNDIPKGKEFVLFYFSPYCPYCRAQLEDIIKNIRELRHIQFYLVTHFPLSDMREFTKEYKLTSYPNISVSRDTADFTARYFKTPGFPYTAIYNKDKRLVKTFVGMITSKQIQAVAVR